MSPRLGAVLFLLVVRLSITCHGQNAATGECAAFAPDGSVATGTLLVNSDLETHLQQKDGSKVALRVSIDEPDVARGTLRQCKEAFSADGRWLATVVAGNRLTVVIADRKGARLYKKFYSSWFALHDAAMEPFYYSSFLGGFLPDNSLLLWRYVPHGVRDPSGASHVDLHMQRWSVDGELLSDRSLGPSSSGPKGRRQPLGFTTGGLLWVPGSCREACYQELDLSGAQITTSHSFQLSKDDFSPVVLLPHDEGFLSILGDKHQKAVLLDSSGHIEASAKLPFFPNLLGPLVPDWFYANEPAISSDGKIAAIGRSHVAWVLVDTDRDWGSEILLLRVHPLSVITRLKVGKGGLGSVAVDHRDGRLRLVGFWRNGWHDLECNEEAAGRCQLRDSKADKS